MAEHPLPYWNNTGFGGSKPLRDEYRRFAWELQDGDDPPFFKPRIWQVPRLGKLPAQSLQGLHDYAGTPYVYLIEAVGITHTVTAKFLGGPDENVDAQASLVNLHMGTLLWYGYLRLVPNVSVTQSGVLDASIYKSKYFQSFLAPFEPDAAKTRNTNR